MLEFVQVCLGPRALLNGRLPGSGGLGRFLIIEMEGKKITPTGGSDDKTVPGT